MTDNMDGLTFIAEIIKSLAWPITIVILVFLLKKPLINLIVALKKIKYRDLELEFGEGLAKVKKLEKKTPQVIQDEETKKMIEHFKQLAEVSPQTCILDAWKEVEIAARNVMKRTFPSVAEVELRRSPMSTVNILHKRGILNESQRRVYDRLYILRSAAIHGDEFALNNSDAIDYAIHALKLVSYFNNFQKN